MCRRRIRIYPGTSRTRGEDHGSHPPLFILAGKSLGYKEGRSDDIFGTAQRCIQFDGAVHGPVFVIDLLDVYAIDLSVLVMKPALADGLEFLGAIPVAAHVDEHGIGMENLFQ